MVGPSLHKFVTWSNTSRERARPRFWRGMRTSLLLLLLLLVVLLVLLVLLILVLLEHLYHRYGCTFAPSKNKGQRKVRCKTVPLIVGSCSLTGKLRNSVSLSEIQSTKHGHTTCAQQNTGTSFIGNDYPFVPQPGMSPNTRLTSGDSNRFQNNKFHPAASQPFPSFPSTQTHTHTTRTQDAHYARWRISDA